MLTIGALASTRIIAVTPDTYASDATAIMGSLRISCLLVAHKGVPLGIITERDIILSASRILGFPDLEVRDIMSVPVLTMGSATPFKEACRQLLANEIGHLVLLDAAGEIEGVVTPTDLLRAPGFERCLGNRMVEEAMSDQVITTSGQETTRYALARMAENQMGAIVIVDQQRPVAIFTDRDAVRLMGRHDPDLWTAPLTQFLRPLISVAPQTPIREGIAIMRQNQIRKLVVVDADGLLLGLFGQRSLLKSMERFCGGKGQDGQRAMDCGFVEVSSACQP
jgi:CBS domain-containing protein